MIILDRPYISEELRDYLIRESVPVLHNDTAVECLGKNSPNLFSSEQFISLYDKERRLYTCSENSIDWVVKNLQDRNLLDCIERMKNKATFRQLLAPMYPDFFFRQATLSELSALDTHQFSYPFVLKPQVGFFSVGVYPIASKLDWDNALADLFQHVDDWKKTYPESVVNTEFILEQYIHGQEFAIDAYYDENGKAVILNILKHDFDGMSDVSDRLYCTGKSVIENNIDRFTNWLTEVNRYFKISNFPFHAEVRVENGKITPIEFNPMRCAGWCCTDISLFAFGFCTYDYFLQRRKPDWEKLLKGKEDQYYTLIIMNKSNPKMSHGVFDYDAACKNLGEILCLRKIDFHSNPIYGFLFTKIEKNGIDTMQRITQMNFDTFVRNPA